jgi:uroporphyrinogen decarboxylase
MTDPISPRSGRDRFLNALHGTHSGPPPVWLMRQAGRYLPEYRALKERYDFLTLVKTPELATEVTLQPIRRFGFDAAILFSDILVIPEAMGQPYAFRDQGGIEMAFALRHPDDFDRLREPEVEETLGYVPAALRLLKDELNGAQALLGFGGAPWTLATYMIAGGSSPHAVEAKTLFFRDRPRFDALMEQITRTLIRYFRMQAAAGADAIQIFDSWAGVCPADHYQAMSLQWIERILEALRGVVPVILFAKDAPVPLERLAQSGASALGLGWSSSLPEARKALGAACALQGNLDPVLLTTTPDLVATEVRRLRDSMAGAKNWIFNLGHGITPDARIDCVETLLATLREPS